MTGDLQLTCSDCGQDFVFTADDQAFFRERGYSAPKRCRNCRQAKKAQQGGGGGGGYAGGGGGGGFRAGATTGTSVICAGCGQQTTVPFEPRGDRPVFCRSCYQAQTGGGGGGGRDSRRPRGGGGGGRY
jgi:CxxC-x17-CxxC domain-containing protein